MDLNYAIFKSEPIMTLNDLAQIGSHNKREKKAYNSNPDIKLELTKDNIELVPLADKYVKGFYNLTKEYKKITRKLNHSLNVRNERLENVMTNLEEQMKSNKEVMFDKEYVKVKKDTFDSMNKFKRKIKE